MEDSTEVWTSYLEIARRRARFAALCGTVLLLISAAIALGLPAIYKSRAVLLIEQQDIPEDFVRSFVSSYADQRIQIISQRVLTNTNLGKIIAEYDLYAEERKTAPLERVVEEMRDDITVAPISVDVVDQRSGKATKATIALELAFDSHSPILAQRVANDLVSIFLNENLKQRSEATEDTMNFLTAESERMRSAVSDLEKSLALFKERNAGALPELSSLNVQLMNKAEQDLVQVENQIRSLEQQRVYLESELSQQQPNSQLFTERGERLLSPGDRLKVLENEYISTSARYGPKHPDVVAMRKEIDSLRPHENLPLRTSELENQVQNLEAELAAVSERYGPEHPDLKRLTREISSLKKEIENSKANQASQQSAVAQRRPDNPIYIQLQARLEATLSDLQALEGQRSALRAKTSDYEARLTAAPQVEREYRSLSRDYETALNEYQEVLAKLQDAELARSLESEQKGERFSLIEPAVVPQEPDRPNRAVIGLLGVFLSLFGGVSAGAVAEAVDSRIYGRGGVVRLITVPPLAVIPFLDNVASVRVRRRRMIIWIVALAAVLASVLGLIHFLVSPLDVLYFRGLRVLGI